MRRAAVDRVPPVVGVQARAAAGAGRGVVTWRRAGEVKPFDLAGPPRPGHRMISERPAALTAAQPLSSLAHEHRLVPARPSLIVPSNMFSIY